MKTTRIIFHFLDGFQKKYERKVGRNYQITIKWLWFWVRLQVKGKQCYQQKK